MPLRADSQILYGNACDIRVEEGAHESTVYFAADPHGGPECLWFCLRLAADRPGTARPIRLVLQNIGNLLGGRDAACLRPVHRYAQGEWERLPAGQPLNTPDGRRHAVWLIGAPVTHVDVAFCYPYGLPQLQRLVEETGGTYQVDTIGVSQGGRPLLRLSNRYGDLEKTLPGFYIIARQHAHETPGSWVLDGFLRELARETANPPVVWSVPLTNIDGIQGGDYGKDNVPYDLNRAWGQPPMRHETLVMQRDLERWKARCRPCLALDLHAPGGCDQSGVYVYEPDPEAAGPLAPAIRAWSTRFCEALGPAFAAEDFARTTNYRSRWETPRFTCHALAALQVPALSFEFSYQGRGHDCFTTDSYREIGRRLAAACLAGAADAP